VTIHRHGGNASAQSQKGTLAEESFREELYTLDRFYEKGRIELKFYRKMSGVYWFKLAEFYYRNRYFTDAAAAYRKSLQNDFLRGKAMLKFVMSKLRSA
jgi:hypothetical protein